MPPIFGFDRDPSAADDAFGFPEAIRKAFIRTANATNSVLMSRVPGMAATMLINERYDLKGYFVKAKSCNWGPMAGFICSTPEFSKTKDVTDVTIHEQRYALLDYLEVLWDLHMPLPDPPPDPNPPPPPPNPVRPRPRVPSAHPTRHPEDIEELRPFRDDAFIPIWISTARKAFLQTEPAFVNRKVYDDVKGVGIACNEKKTVMMPFVLRKLESIADMWAVFHGGVYRKQGTAWVQQEEDELLRPDQVYDDKIKAADLIAFNAADKFADAVGGDWPFGDDPNKDIVIRPVLACRNPFPAFLDYEQRYRNAFAGDYDLFAVWPASHRPDMKRASEKAWLPAAGETRPDERQTWYERAGIQLLPMFVPVRGRAFTVESFATRGLYVEVVPAKREMDHGLEDQQLGNINQVVMNACVLLNSEAAAGYLKRNKNTGKIEQDARPPNVAFHSDEGGRHSITKIEWPIAVFLPQDLATDLGLAADLGPPGSGRSFVFEDRPESRRNFLRFVAGLLGRCEVAIASGWLLDLLTDPKDDTQTRRSDLAPSIVELLLTGRYDEQAPRRDALAVTLIELLKPPADPPPAQPWPANSGTYTYRRVIALLDVRRSA